jgi:serine/threonine protein kinase
LIEYQAHLPPHAQPSMDYMAPEYANNSRTGPWSDMYSIGVMMYALFNNGKPLFRNGDNFEIFRTNAGEVSNIPEEDDVNVFTKDIKSVGCIICCRKSREINQYCSWKIRSEIH